MDILIKSTSADGFDVSTQVDAALDLSHTQNIGRMIRAHFPYSQFIVVSLKEGMFNNANVIFRTKFLEGVSTVTRASHNARSAAVEWHARAAVLQDCCACCIFLIVLAATVQKAAWPGSVAESCGNRVLESVGALCCTSGFHSSASG